MLNGRVLIVVVVISIFCDQPVWSDTAVDYCSKELCKFPWTKDEPKHIACESPEGFGPKCGTNAVLAEISPELKAALAQKVNAYRNKVAAGGEVIAGGGWKFRPAVRMAYMDWDDELAHVAGLATKTCTQMNDDACFNTNNFKSTAAASHIVGTTVSPSGANATQHILNAIDNFYNQHDKLWLEKVDQYPKADQARDFREFALLIADHNTKFGCGCTYADSTPGWINFYVTCVFSTKNVDPSPVYKTGETSASGCTKKHETFSNLCDASEDIDPNFGYKGLQNAWDTEEAKWHTSESLKEYLNGISSQKYLCDEELCGPTLQYDDLQPLRCNITLALGPGCIKPRVYKMPKESQQKILDAFNAIRNETAGGELIGADGAKLPKAKEMPYLQWDEELAELALLPLLDCPKRIPNICGNTYKYGATDSIESFWPSNSKYEPDDIMASVYPGWWKDARKAIKPEHVEKFPDRHISYPFRYLSLIIADHATKVGCAYLLNRQKLDVNGYYFNCIFSTQKIEGLPIYNVTDQSASGCEKKHPKYTNLCDESESVDPNLMSSIIKERLKRERYDTKAGNEYIKSINKSANYCDKDLCRGSSNPQHVACAKLLTFGPKCSKNVQLLKFTPEFKQRILDRHNYYRNLTAGGESVGENEVILPKAVKMGYMQWDDELANIAAMNAKDCGFEHDSCRNTKKFTHAGQNLFMASGAAYPDTRIEQGVDSWYSEVKFTSPEQIAKYPVVSPPHGRDIGHFTVMVNEKSIRVGCAMSLYAQKLENMNYLVCNYAFTNMQAHRVYKSGDVVASECTKRDEKYINLCHPDEDIDPNNLYDLAPSLKTFVQKNPGLSLLTPKKKKNDTAIHDILKPIVARDYCDPTLCRPGVVHIGCNKTAQMGPNCGDDKKIVFMTPANIELILDLHNSLRNKTAGGHVRGAESSFLPKAARMAYMQWDQELADLALLNLQNCESAHDRCHNTKKFYMSGQNLFGASESPPSTNNTEFLKIGINGWFQEHEYVLPKVLAAFTSESVPPGLAIGHFTVMVNEKATRVGCAAVSYYSDKFTHFKLTCNYAVTNMLNDPVYRAGNTSGSECKSLHPVYTELCDASEDINPNDGLSLLGAKPKAPTFNFKELMNRTGLPFGDPSIPGTFNLTAISGPSMTDILTALNESQPTTVVFHGPMSAEDLLKIFTQQQKGEGSDPTLSASNATTHQIFKVLDLDKEDVQGRFGGEIDSNTIEEVTTEAAHISSTTPAVTTSPNAIEEPESTTVAASVDETEATTVPAHVDEPKVTATTIHEPELPKDLQPNVTTGSVDEPRVTTVPAPVDEPEVTTFSAPVDEPKATVIPADEASNATNAEDKSNVATASDDELRVTTVPAPVDEPEVTTFSTPVDEPKATVIPAENTTNAEDKPNVATASDNELRVTTVPAPVDEPKVNATAIDEPQTGIYVEDKPKVITFSGEEPELIIPFAANEPKLIILPPITVTADEPEEIIYRTINFTVNVRTLPTITAYEHEVFTLPTIYFTANEPEVVTLPTFTDELIVTPPTITVTANEPEVNTLLTFTDELIVTPPTITVTANEPEVLTLPTFTDELSVTTIAIEEARTGIYAEDKPKAITVSADDPDVTTLPTITEVFDTAPHAVAADEIKPTPGAPNTSAVPSQVVPEDKSPDGETVAHPGSFPMQPNGSVVIQETRVFSTPNMDPFGQPGRGWFGNGFPGFEETHTVQGETVVHNTVTGGVSNIPGVDRFGIPGFGVPSFEHVVISHNQVQPDGRTGPPSSGPNIFSRGGFGIPGLEHINVQQIPAPTEESMSPSPNDHSIFRRIGFGMPGFERVPLPQNTNPTETDNTPPSNTHGIFSRGSFGMPGLEHFNIHQNPVPTQDGRSPPPNSPNFFSRGGFGMPGLEHFNIHRNPAPTPEGMSPSPNSPSFFNRGGFGMPGFENIVITQRGGNFNPYLGQQHPGNMPTPMQSSHIYVQRSFGPPMGNPYGGMLGEARPSPMGGWFGNSPMTSQPTAQNVH